jgi:hypothetical protein
LENLEKQWEKVPTVTPELSLESEARQDGVIAGFMTAFFMVPAVAHVTRTWIMWYILSLPYTHPIRRGVWYHIDGSPGLLLFFSYFYTFLPALVFSLSLGFVYTALLANLSEMAGNAGKNGAAIIFVLSALTVAAAWATFRGRYAGGVFIGTSAAGICLQLAGFLWLLPQVVTRFRSWQRDRQHGIYLK